jgi:alkylation response protein AidB-like acyl-CoA dehydrogenase
LKGLGQTSLGKDVAARERDSTFDPEDWRRCAEHGVQGLLLPPSYGGAGYGPAAYVRAMEGLGEGCPDNGLLMALGAHILAVEVPLLQFGEEQQRSRYLPGLASGQLVGANAMSEPGSGSDALALTTTAERDGGGYRLTGRKSYVTNAPVADVFIVYATVDRALGFTGVTAFLLERNDPGLSIRTGSEKMGLRTAPWGELELDGCRVSAARRLGAEKQGSAIFARTMAWERALLPAPWLGAMRREIDECVRFCRRRRQFGKNIGSFQSVSNRLVDMQIRQEISRMMTFRAAAELGERKPGVFPEMNKLYTSEAAVATFSDALKIYGALGYTTERRVERNLRDALGGTISSGTSDLQRVIIAKSMKLSWPEPW